MILTLMLSLILHPDPPTCAMVNPVANAVVWRTADSRIEHVATYRGNDRIVYSRPVPRIVRYLVEQRPGRVTRHGCRW